MKATIKHQHTISSYDMAEIGQQLHSIVMQSIRFTLSKMNKAQTTYLNSTATQYLLPRDVAELVAEKWDWTQRDAVSQHFNVLEQEEAREKEQAIKVVGGNTVSSLIVAQLTGRAHCAILDAARRAFKALEIDPSPYTDSYTPSNYKKPLPMYKITSEVFTQMAKNFTREQKDDINTRYFTVGDVQSESEQALISYMQEAPVSTINPDVPTMSSLEIVDVINSLREQDKAVLRHESFMAKVVKVLGREGAKFFGTQKYGNNLTRNIYNLPKREATLMVMSESYAVQAKVYDRMAELESAQNKYTNMNMITLPDFTNPIVAARAWADEREEKETLQLTLEQAKPAIEFHHAVTEADNVHTFEEASKVLNIGRNKLMAILRGNNVLTKANLPVQSHIDAGRFTVVEHPYVQDGKPKLSASARVTGKGLIYVQKMI